MECAPYENGEQTIKSAKKRAPKVRAHHKDEIPSVSDIFAPRKSVRRPDPSGPKARNKCGTIFRTPKASRGAAQSHRA